MFIKLLEINQSTIEIFVYIQICL